ncbi:MAG: VTT domain-containing protein [Verrucomicrobia bacterium]|nr:VTT domain-containing protein [Verrucomicrobiota bacterium]
MPEPAPVPSPIRPRWLPALVVAVVLGGVLVAVGLYFLGGARLVSEARQAWATAFAALGAAGPVAFFGAMAVLPLFGFPISPFSLAAGPLFGASLGTPLVLVCGIAAIATNLTLAYWLARRALRPLLARLVARLGYRLPAAAGEDATGLIILVRVTPGPPFFVQNYLLGLADVPFGRYLGWSALVQGAFGTAVMLFGDALAQGSGRIAFLALGLLAGLVVATRLVRRHLSRGKATP